MVIELIAILAGIIVILLVRITYLLRFEKKPQNKPKKAIRKQIKPKKSFFELRKEAKEKKRAEFRKKLELVRREKERKKKEKQQLFLKKLAESKKKKEDLRKLQLENILKENELLVYNYGTKDRTKGKMFYQRAMKFDAKEFIKVSGIIKKFTKKKIMKNKDQYVIVRIHTINEGVREFFAKSDVNGFEYNKGRYIFDDNSKKWNSTAQMWYYDYHEFLTIPYDLQEVLPIEIRDAIDQYNKQIKYGKKAKINIEKIKEIIEETDSIDVETAVNPKALQSYQKANFVQALVAGADMNKYFRLILIIVLIGGFLTLITLGISAYGSGLFETLSSGLS